MKSKQRAVVICPGRGSYSPNELGYLENYRKQFPEFIKNIDKLRQQQNQITISELDAASRFSPSLHLPGENASTLIHSCAMLDFMSINPDNYDIVAITGNSMGWYIALACAGVLGEESAFHLINTMGSMMQNKIIGGQLVYPIVDKDWRLEPNKLDRVQKAIEQTNQIDDHKAYISIRLGGYLVIAGNNKAIRHLLKSLPPVDDTYPMKLNKHAAFHSPLLQETSENAFKMIPMTHFKKGHTSLIDGRGHIWNPISTDITSIYNYTLNYQVTQTYDFTRAITVALKEFCPDKLILLGPGASLGGAIGQILVQNQWQGITKKADFIEQQKLSPYLLSMGMTEQKQLAA